MAPFGGRAEQFPVAERAAGEILSLAVFPGVTAALPASRLLVLVVDAHRPSSTGAYVIIREACARLLRIALPLRVHPRLGLLPRSGCLDRVRCVVPMPVHSATLRTTTDYYQPGSMQARLREAVASGRVPIARQILALRRQRTFRRGPAPGSHRPRITQERCRQR